jgi:hypothetical protein
MNPERKMTLDNLWRAAEMPESMILPLTADDDWLFWWLLKDLSTVLLYGTHSNNADALKNVIRNQLEYLVKNE